jgi:hypothetical protein
MTITATFISGYNFGQVKAGDETIETVVFDNMADYQMWARKMDRLNAEYTGDRIHEIVSTKWDCK